MKSPIDYVEEVSAELEADAVKAEELGQLPGDSARILRESGVVRMLQPKEFGGQETSTVEFFETVLNIGKYSGSAGWVAGVVGIHPFEVAQASRTVQEEIWGEDPDAWIASPYAPFGRARRVEGGYVFNGRWSFSSGTDHCQWIVLGGFITDEDGEPQPQLGDRHFLLPRSDYEIVDGSWDVVGLRGTGSKDVVVTDAFIPDHRVINPKELETGEGAAQAGRGDVALYRLPFHTMFGSVIACGTLAIADGALRSFIEYNRTRVTYKGVQIAKDPVVLAALGSAAADIAASRLQFLTDQRRMWDLAEAGKEIPLELRAETRAHQVQAVRRSAAAVDRLMGAAGGGAMRHDMPLQRFWRDIRIAQNHAANSGEVTLVNDSLLTFGEPVLPRTRL